MLHIHVIALLAVTMDVFTIAMATLSTYYTLSTIALGLIASDNYDGSGGSTPSPPSRLHSTLLKLIRLDLNHSTLHIAKRVRECSAASFFELSGVGLIEASCT
jgi:hypothetical protein